MKKKWSMPFLITLTALFSSASFAHTGSYFHLHWLNDSIHLFDVCAAILVLGFIVLTCLKVKAKRATHKNTEQK